jgi:MerR family transcriptional regulator, copper efflux regulator
LSAARAIGFFIAKIKELLVLAKPNRVPCAEVQSFTAAHLGEVRANIAALRKLEAVLATALACYFWGQRPTCPVLDELGPAQIS